MQAGLLNDRIKIEALTVTRNQSNGDQVMTWTQIWSGRARVTFSSGSQMLENGEMVNTISRQVTIRTKPAFTSYKLTSLRIVINGQHYRPLSMDVRNQDMATIFNVELINE